MYSLGFVQIMRAVNVVFNEYSPVLWLMILVTSMAIALLISIFTNHVVTFLMSVMLACLGTKMIHREGFLVHMVVVLSYCFILNFSVQYFVRYLWLPEYIYFLPFIVNVRWSYFTLGEVQALELLTLDYWQIWLPYLFM